MDDEWARAMAAALRLQTEAYVPTSTSKMKAGLLAMADAYDSLADRLAGTMQPRMPEGASVLIVRNSEEPLT